MKLYGLDEVVGHKVGLNATDKKHFRFRKTQENPDAAVKSFSELFSGALGKVNDLQMQSNDLTKKMITKPESVSIHSVMIAAQKAEMALALTKSITDRVLRAYKEITNLR
ncbi:MAG: flagellar hook-basal body complex protein FliE [Spirochaetes bacterium]|nr:flagellar hook-basal body complex protein FliE [Spirochaetota bacterium]